MIIEDDVLAFLDAIDRGFITLQIEGAWDWCGNTNYLASNGWKVTVFVDCGEWDYVDSITHPEHARIGFWYDSSGEFYGEPWSRVRGWHPNEETQEKNWPGDWY